MNKTIYVTDLNVWHRAKTFAHAHGISLSRLITDALTFYLDRLTNASK